MMGRAVMTAAVLSPDLLECVGDLLGLVGEKPWEPEEPERAEV